LALLLEECSTPGGHCSDYLQLLTEQLLLRGRIPETQQSLERISDDYRDNTAVFWGWLNFLICENDQAIKYYTLVKALRKKPVAKAKDIFFNTMGGLFFILALLKMVP